MAKRRTKRRTHVRPGANGQQLGGVDPDTPKSFVMRSGKVSKCVLQLVQNVRKVMEPNTAAKLKERRRNRLKDFVQVAAQLGVSHFMIFSQSDSGTNLRIGRTPHGPTLIFRVHGYSLVKDVASAQIRPRSPGQEYQQAPLLVMNNFKGNERAMQLMTTVFQNMFPPLHVQKMKLTECRRVVLLHYDPETRRVEWRHYYINARPVGVSKSVKRILQTNDHMPDLHDLRDISEYVLNDPNVSESEAEDNRETVVTMAGNYVGRANKKADHQQRAIRLTEIGPRLTLQLIKIQDGFCDGEVLHHEFIKRTPEEVAALKRAREQRQQEKQQRRAEQEANVARKLQEKEEHRKKCTEGGKQVRFADEDGEELDSEEEEDVISSDESEGEILEEFHDEGDRFDHGHARMHDDTESVASFTTDGSHPADNDDDQSTDDDESSDGEDLDEAASMAALKRRKVELTSKATAKPKAAEAAKSSQKKLGMSLKMAKSKSKSGKKRA